MGQEYLAMGLAGPNGQAPASAGSLVDADAAAYPEGDADAKAESDSDADADADAAPDSDADGPGLDAAVVVAVPSERAPWHPATSAAEAAAAAARSFIP